MTITDPSSAIGLAVLGALGLDAERCSGFTLRCKVGQVPTITVTNHVWQIDATELQQITERYTVALTPIAPTEDTTA